MTEGVGQIQSYLKIFSGSALSGRSVAEAIKNGNIHDSKREGLILIPQDIP